MVKKKKNRENDVEVKIVAANIFTVGTDLKAHDLFIRLFRPVCMFPIQTMSHGSLQTDVGTIVPLAPRAVNNSGRKGMSRRV